MHREEGGEGVGGVALGAEDCVRLVSWSVCWGKQGCDGGERDGGRRTPPCYIMPA